MIKEIKMKKNYVKVRKKMRDEEGGKKRLFTKKGERKRLCTNELEKNDLEEVVKEIVLVIKEKKEG